MKLHFDLIQRLARAHHIEDPLHNVDAFTRFLQFWWCQKFNRPLKDPVLQSYTLDELCYEYIRYYYTDPANDPRKELEAKAVREDEDAWIKEQLARFKSQADAKKSSQVEVKDHPPTATSALTNPEELPSASQLPEISTTFEE